MLSGKICNEKIWGVFEDLSGLPTGSGAVIYFTQRRKGAKAQRTG
ncbi:MAG: hypothetical protein ABI581_10810 [Sediminibacterium sp.]